MNGWMSEWTSDFPFSPNCHSNHVGTLEFELGDMDFISDSFINHNPGQGQTLPEPQFPHLHTEKIDVASLCASNWLCHSMELLEFQLWNQKLWEEHWLSPTWHVASGTSAPLSYSVLISETMTYGSFQN